MKHTGTLYFLPMIVLMSDGNGHLDCFANSTMPSSIVPTFQYSQTPHSLSARLLIGIGSFREAYFAAFRNGRTSAFPFRIWLLGIMSHSMSSANWASAVVQSSCKAAQKKVEKGVAVDPCSKSLLFISVMSVISCFIANEIALLRNRADAG